MKRIRISIRMLEILKLVSEYGCEGWGETMTHVEHGTRYTRSSDFYRSADALTRHGLVRFDEQDVLEITDIGRLALRMARAGTLRVS